MAAFAKSDGQGWALKVMMGDPNTQKIWSSDFRSAPPESTKDFVFRCIKETQAECKKQGISLPDEVSEHALLHFWDSRN